ncbi:KamA family radical SAM protein [Streptomyces alanosinicus]|uniref:L-lysine 2,3-aminomutase n=1 Tax=Streptomyces alanosinicus TaxID=68171 RepID=A0A918YLD3_9ACTN|nr:lysine 2,3-aminomutase [Streptomyces alanosinicus]GHE08120.1 putative L-lysine 2,3-aminomutase [Streptomyces alanosinicus]
MYLTVDGTTRFRAYGPRQLDEIARRYPLPDAARETVRLLSRVLPFRVNEYVLSELVDWTQVPDDPVYQLVFPQHGMLDEDDTAALRRLAGRRDGDPEVVAAVRAIRARLNPHPGGQQELNVPRDDSGPVPGLQHKYRETVLYFPGQGQTCHAYCTYCFRWAQFVGDAELRFAAPGPQELIRYLRGHPEVTDVLVTGGDPMVMTSARLRAHLEPLLEVPTVRTVRIGTKSPAYWPQRYVSDADADDVLRLFERVVASGRTLAVMAHFSHPRELATPLAQRALERIRRTGAVVYCQAPLIGHVNDSADTWSALWRAELAAGCVPYYMFVARDTGPHAYYRVPLARAVDVYQGAYRELPGLARTVRGPVMSTTLGKAVVDGVEELPEGRYFRLRLLQARDPRLVGRPFRAPWSATAAWFDELRPDAGGDDALRAALASGGAARTEALR